MVDERYDPEWIAQNLIGCSWGRKMIASGDVEPCPERAVQIVMLHDRENGTEYEVRLCEAHLAIVLAETEPSKGDSDV